MVLNSSKSELFVNDVDPQREERTIGDFKEIAPNIRSIDDSTLFLLEAPILENAFDSMVSSKLTDLQRMITHLKNMSRHKAFYLIKNCLFIPKLLSVFRFSPLYNSNELVDMD